jgi:hypothetical protein
MPMDEGKLARLREIAERGAYAGLEAPVRDFMDEAFGSDIPPLYSGVRTLLSAPLQQDLGALDVALVGVPFDLGVVNRPGARFGPRAVREISSVGPYHHHTRVLPAMLCRIGDVGDVELQRRHSLDEGIEEIERYFHRLVDAGVTPLSVGGDHSITYPILKALGRDEPVGCVHIDAHCDTGPEWGGSKFHHGGPFRNAALAGAGARGRGRRARLRLLRRRRPRSRLRAGNGHPRSGRPHAHRSQGDRTGPARARRHRRGRGGGGTRIRPDEQYGPGGDHDAVRDPLRGRGGTRRAALER